MDEALMDILPLAARGYCCSQIMGLLALTAQGREDADLVRALGGLCRGVAESGGSCGILTGGACVLSLYVGRGADNETPHERAALVLSSFADWFIERTNREYGGSTCTAILGEGVTKPDMSRCGNLLAEAWTRLVGILAENGLDVSVGRDA
ncbi:MAG: C-GCAxxG-C-C family protein [Humidesulfovibrio sp.]|nr:C-GCAxxG-C-C family protein [Humidesulfovibrio sp.]